MRRALTRRTLATVTVAGALALPLGATAASADEALAAPVLAQDSETDRDEPLAEDGDDDTGKYGLIGLTGLFGLFGYKKYRDHRATTAGAGTTGDGTSRRT